MNTTTVRQNLLAAVKTALDGKECLDATRSAFDAVFTANAGPLRPNRLVTLQRLVQDSILPACIASSMEAAKPAVDQAVRAAMAQLYATPFEGIPDWFEPMERGIVGMLISHVIEAVHHKDRPLPQAFKLPPDFALEEAEYVQAKRAALTALSEKYRTAQAKISKIEDYLSVSQSPSHEDASVSLAAAIDSAAA